MTEKVPLKETALNHARITRIGREVQAVCPAFDAEGFARDVLADFPQLELKARIARTSEALSAYLPVTGAQAVELLLRSLPPTPEDAGATTDFGLYIYAPHSDFVARFCRTGEDLDCALEALRRLSPYFSAEDAVRYFINDFPEDTLNAIESWTRDTDHRVRRLASESTRPRLPWSPRITLELDAALPILERLHTDSSRFVTRSVANHLHDIAFDRPDIVLDTLGRWKSSAQTAREEFTFIAREALRTRLKAGHPAAYEFLGYPSDPPVELSPIHLERTRLSDGDTLEFSVDLSTTSAANLRVNYVIASPSQRGARREKVYFLKTATAAAGQTLRLAKRHTVQSTSTSTLRPGAYTLTIQVNGRRFCHPEFQVVER